MLRSCTRLAVALLASLAALAAPRAAAETPLRLVRQGDAEVQVTEPEAMRFLQDKHCAHLSGQLSCNKLGDYHLLRLSGAAGREPAFVILFKPGQQLPPQQLEAAAARYLRVCGLSGYRCHVAADGSMAMLIRNRAEGTPPPAVSRQLAFEALCAKGGLYAPIEWLQALCGAGPQRLEGSALVWRLPVSHRGQKGTLELALDLLRGIPCYVELRLQGIPARYADELLAELAQLRLETPRRATQLKSRPTVRLAGTAEEKLPSGRARLCMLQPVGNQATFHLGERAKLLFLYDTGRIDSTPALPQVESIPWADELPPVLKAPQRAEEPAAPMSPAEARDEYTRRLREL